MASTEASSFLCPGAAAGSPLRPSSPPHLLHLFLLPHPLLFSHRLGLQRRRRRRPPPLGPTAAAPQEARQPFGGYFVDQAAAEDEGGAREVLGRQPLAEEGHGAQRRPQRLRHHQHRGLAGGHLLERVGLQDHGQTCGDHAAVGQRRSHLRGGEHAQEVRHVRPPVQARPARGHHGHGQQLRRREGQLGVVVRVGSGVLGDEQVAEAEEHGHAQRVEVPDAKAHGAAEELEAGHAGHPQRRAQRALEVQPPVRRAARQGHHHHLQ
mmetsp:Transcript_30493/g.50479  ORF Transcript_30493/g.50479 Transcript_30493/m.50479 type:complete len:265 (-) Transcript_30493:641-1435(-)